MNMWLLDTQPRSGAGDAAFLREAAVAELPDPVCHIY
jgi:hypothetical protein